MTNEELNRLLWQARRRIVTVKPGTPYAPEAWAARALIGAEVKRRRLAAGLTLSALAQRAKVYPSGVFHAEKGGGGSILRLVRILAKLGYAREVKA